MRLHAATADDTRAIGGALAPLLEPGDAVILTGELGAGKTTLVQGLVRALGADEHVASPTFTIVREYASGRLPIVHVDVYRLQRMQDVIDLALDDLQPGGVLVVEWGDEIEELLPPERLRIELRSTDPTGEAEDREIEVDGTPGWHARVERLGRALERLRA